MQGNSTKEREILDRYLRPIVEQFEKKIKRHAIFFLYPPTPGKESDSVRYYGLDPGDEVATPSHEDIERASALFDARYAALFEGQPEGTAVGFEEFPSFIHDLVARAEALFGGDRPRAFGALRSVAREILVGSSVRIRPPEGEGKARSETQILLAHAFDMANSDRSGGAPDEVSKAGYPDPKFCTWFTRTRGRGKFLTNADFELPDEPPPDPDCTLLITQHYLTRPGYLTGGLVADPKGGRRPEGTFREFAAECLFTLEDEKLTIEDPKKLREFLSSLRQIHLPVASLGQYRGSVCWISYESFRTPLERARLSRELDRHFQGVLAEFFSLAMIDVYETMVGDALRLLVPGRDETWEQFEKKFYSQLGVAFGYLIGSQKIEFIGRDRAGNGRIVSYTKGDVHFSSLPTGDAVQGNADFPEAFVTVDKPGDAAVDGTEVTFHLGWAAEGSKADRASAESVTDTIRCDRVRCHAYFITDTKRLIGRGAMIRQAIYRQVEHYVKDKVAQRDSISSLFTHSMTNLFRELDLNRSAVDLARIMTRISGHIQLAESAGLETLRIKLSQVGSIVRRLQRQRDLWKMADDGKLPAEWRGQGKFARHWLEQWCVALRKLILNYTSTYNSLLRLKTENHFAGNLPTIAVWEAQAGSRELRRVMDSVGAEIIGDGGFLGIDLPPFNPHHADEGFLMTTMALEEIVRNPLKTFYNDELRETFLKLYGAVFIIYAITLGPDEDSDEVVVRTWNPYFGEFDVEKGSRSLRLIKEDMRGLQRFAKVGDLKVVGLDDLPFDLPVELKRRPGMNLVQSRFSVKPGLFFD